MIRSDANNRPPMLDKDLYDSWKSRMGLYMQNRDHGRTILETIENVDCDMKATNIILQGLPTDIYSLVNHYKVAKDLWEKQFQVNTKFLNTLPPEWSKFVTDVKLVKDLHTTNFDQLHAYLEQHKFHANEVRLLCERNQDPLAFFANQQMTPPHFNTYQSSYNNPQLQQQFPLSQYGSIHPNQHYSSTYPSQPQFNHSSVPPSYSYQSQMNHQTSFVSQIAYQSPQVTTQPMTESPLVDSGFAVPVFSLGDDPIACLNKAMAFLTAVASSRFPSTNNQLRTSFNPRNQATIQDGRTEDLDTYDSDCDDISNAKAVLMANISNYGSDVISEVPHSATYLNDMENQSVHAMQDFEQLPIVDFSDNEIHSDSNIIPYSQYLQETQLTTVQDTTLQAQQDSMILSVIEQMSKQMINHVNNWEKANKEHNNESVTAKLERYKERVKTFEQRLNIDLSSREKMIDSQMDDMIKEKLALKEQVDSLEKNLSKQIKEKECLLQTFTVFKNESKEKENKYMENEIDLEKKINELDNIIFKVGQSAQTVHMLTKPQAFYDNIHKQALGYQNPFYLKKAQRIKPTLYDGIVISAKHVAMPVIDDEETLILKEENFRKRFAPQQELLAKQAFWLRMSNPTSKPSDASPVKIEAPQELPTVSLVNENLKKLKFHLAMFDNMVKIRTTLDARTEGEWGFEHTKAVFNNEIIPFLKSLKDIFNVFDKDLLNEIIEVQTVFDQMDAAVQ
ncbi:hypothetical protein Tco_0127129 [Tanacetum coccineum]